MKAETAEPEPDTIAEEQETTAAEKTEAGSWVSAYKSVIEDQIAESENPTCNFALIYLDDDDIPELAVQPGDFHASSAKLYMFDGSEAVSLGEFGSWGQLSYVPRKGIIISGYTGQGSSFDTVLEYKDGEVSELYNSSIEMSFEDGSEQYYFNGEKVSEAEYNAETAKYRTGDLVAAPNPGAENTYPLSLGGVDSFVSDFG